MGAAELAKDPRIDRAVTWGICAMATGAFAFGGSSFSGLRDEVRGLRDDMSKLGTRLAVVEAAELQRRVEKLEQIDAERRLHNLERGGK